jgi:hypothetical protein
MRWPAGFPIVLPLLRARLGRRDPLQGLDVLGKHKLEALAKVERISLTHWLTNPFGAITSVRLTSPRSFNSLRTSPASIVLPKPTSSARRYRTRSLAIARDRRPNLVRQRNHRGPIGARRTPCVSASATRAAAAR